MLGGFLTERSLNENVDPDEAVEEENVTVALVV